MMPKSTPDRGKVMLKKYPALRAAIKEFLPPPCKSCEAQQAVVKAGAKYINELCNPPSHYDPDDYDEEGRSPVTFLRLDYEKALAALSRPDVKKVLEDA